MLGNHHTYYDWLLLLGRIEIATPTPKKTKIDIEGADGALDMSEAFGNIKYNNAENSFTFYMFGDRALFIARYTEIKNAIHGEKVRIILDDDSAYFLLGRLTVGSLKTEKGYAAFNVEADCDPYKYRISKTVIAKDITGSGTVILTNGRKRAVPEITATAAMTIGYMGDVWAINAGSITIPEFELSAGENIISVTGTGKITFAWQEGDL